MLFLDFSLRSVLPLLLSVLSLDFSLCPVLALPFSFCSVLGLDFSTSSSVVVGVGQSRGGSFSMADMNFLRCLKYSGYNSKLQWFPPLSHRGSYFSLHNSHSCFPWEISTTSSSVPYKDLLLNGNILRFLHQLILNNIIMLILSWRKAKCSRVWASMLEVWEHVLCHINHLNMNSHGWLELGSQWEEFYQCSASKSKEVHYLVNEEWN